MTARQRAYAAGAATVALFVLVQVGALALVQPFEAAGYRAVEDPTNPTNSVVYVLAILVATGVMLAAFRFGVDQLVRLLVVGSGALLAAYVFSVLVPPVVTIPNAGVASNGLALALALVLAGALLVHPEWYVIDAAGVVMGAGAAGLFGISFGLLPAIVLLTVLAVYDAISVYGTEHMLTLASGVMDLKVPVVLVVPLTLSYSYLDASPPATAEGEDADEIEDRDTAGADGDGEAGLNRDAFFIGLGDAVMPTIIVASAAAFSPAPGLGVPGFGVNLPALCAMVGTLVGLVALVGMVMRGRAHAGLPLLNGGAIGGYLLGSLASGVSLVTALGLGPYL